ncbi:MAG: TRAP transporter small permease [Syntrophaceae bacterium]|nr:TRAP transporter small permease [Syntrophaceae bacterium]
MISRLRHGLNTLFNIGGWMGACFVALIAVIIIIQVIGRELGYQVRGADDFTAWSVAASIFFALAYTLKKGGHIRVTLIIERLRGRSARAATLISLFVGTLVTGMLALSAIHLVADSYRFEEVAQGLLSVPLWIPQMGLLLGSLLLFLALLDSFLVALFTADGTDRQTR